MTSPRLLLSILTPSPILLHHVRTIAGSGEIKVTDGSDNIVTVGSRPTLTFTYTAAVALEAATLVIAQPATEGGWVPLTFQTGTGRAREENHVTTTVGTVDATTYWGDCQ